jgi:hypothetical protein
MLHVYHRLCVLLTSARQVKLARYYRAQLELLADLCLDANTRSIEELRKQFSFELCFNAVRDPLLPREIRGAMTGLLENIHMKRLPHQGLSLPRTVRVLPGLDAARAGELALEPELGKPDSKPLPRFWDEVSGAQ